MKHSANKFDIFNDEKIEIPLSRGLTFEEWELVSEIERAILADNMPYIHELSMQFEASIASRNGKGYEAAANG